MVSSVSPNYYATGNFKFSFEVIGENFDVLPNDIIGLPSTNNNDPLLYRDSQATSIVCSVAEKSNNRMLLNAVDEAEHSPAYLGALLSADRETVYWTNNTKPLP